MNEERKKELELKCQLEKEEDEKKLQYKKTISKEIIDEINRAIKNGKLSVTYILQENWNRKFDTKSFEYNDVIEKFVSELRDKQYTVFYGNDSVYHDTTFDYMNSGGECGSSTPYYTDVLSLRIMWDKN